MLDQFILIQFPRVLMQLGKLALQRPNSFALCCEAYGLPTWDVHSDQVSGQICGMAGRDDSVHATRGGMPVRGD